MEGHRYEFLLQPSFERDGALCELADPRGGSTRLRLAVTFRPIATLFTRKP
jgi:hypothetical protein